MVSNVNETAHKPIQELIVDSIVLLDNIVSQLKAIMNFQKTGRFFAQTGSEPKGMSETKSMIEETLVKLKEMLNLITVSKEKTKIENKINTIQEMLDSTNTSTSR